MKFQSVKAFEKHLAEAAPVGQLSHVYVIAASVDYEREKIVEKVIGALPPARALHFDAAATPIEEVVEQLNTRSLFGEKPIVILDRFERLKKGASETLASYLTHPSTSAYLILGAASLKAEFYQKGKRELVICDLTEEKPWDRQRRLKEWLVEEAAKEGKIMAPDAASHLFEHVGLDMACLEQELKKLVCYTGERKTVELKDVMAVCAAQSTASGWQLSESIVWGDKKPVFKSVDDLAEILPLIGQIRYHLEIGLQIAAGISPAIKEQALEKYKTVAKRRPSGFFEKALKALFELELACKSSSVEAGMLWDLFLARIYALSSP